MVPLEKIIETRIDKTGPTGHEFTYIDIGSVELETKRIVEPKICSHPKHQVEQSRF